MKQKRSFFFLLTAIFLAIFISFGCDSNDTNPASSADALVGTWEITTITSTVDGVPITIDAANLATWLILAPELGMIPGTITLNADGTYQVIYLDTEVETGTWTATDTILSVTPGGGTVPITMPYTISGNTATISMSQDDGEGGTVSVELVYTKR